jgi:radical SAM protein with 4Fe4S-binding SPASM domain
MKIEKNSSHPIVALHRPINRQNYRSLQKLADVAHANGCGVVTFSPFKTIGGKYRYLALGPNEEDAVQLALLKTKKKLNALGIKHNVEETLTRYSIGEAVWKVLPCYVGWYHARIKVDGTVVPCEGCNISMGNLRKRSLSSIWNSSKYSSFRKKGLFREGIASLAKDCDCNFCCQVILNKQIHKFFRWASPFVSLPTLKRRFSEI